jgi:uncharacterized protein YjbJ (UPF0337 family)
MENVKENQPMNWDRLEGEWKQRRGKAMHHWGKMMDDDLAAIAGKYEEFVGKLQERYGIVKEEADQQVKDFKRIIGQLKKSNDELMQLQKSLHESEKLSGKRVRATKRVRKPVRSKARK